MIVCRNNEVYVPGEKVSSLVNRPPSIQVGTMGRILDRWVGTLYAVKMPNGDLYRWLSSQDLSPVDPTQHNLRVGDLAVVTLSIQNHFYHPQLESGVVVKIVKIVETDYYEINIDGEGSYGWFTGFELSTVF